MKLRRHPATTGDRFVTLIDLLHDDGTLIESIHIDCLADLGLDADSRREITEGRVVTVDLVRRGQSE